MVIKQLLGSMKEKVIVPFIKEKEESTGLSAEKYKDAARLAHPTKQFTEVDQITDLVLFLCSPAGKTMTGTAIPMDGGITVS
nr:tropinone reductase homolog At2g29360-like [Crassostrea gigas]XP_034320975.1 tropinone reductase homolog At2g29360-like [Crassostrea gigas]